MPNVERLFQPQTEQNSLIDLFGQIKLAPEVRVLAEATELMPIGIQDKRTIFGYMIFVKGGAPRAAEILNLNTISQAVDLRDRYRSREDELGIYLGRIGYISRPSIWQVRNLLSEGKRPDQISGIVNLSPRKIVSIQANLVLAEVLKPSNANLEKVKEYRVFCDKVREFIKMGFSTEEVSAKTGQSIRVVAEARRRLRQIGEIDPVIRNKKDEERHMQAEELRRKIFSIRESADLDREDIARITGASMAQVKRHIKIGIKRNEIKPKPKSRKRKENREQNFDLNVGGE